MEFGHVRRPRLGVTVGPVSAADAEVYKLPSVAGAQITSVQPGEAADRAGIQMGDVVTALNGRQVRTNTAFMEELARLRPGERARLSIVRYGERLEKTVTLGEFETATQTRTARPARPASQELLGFSVVPLTPQIARELGADLRAGVVVDFVEPLGSAAGRVSRGMIIRKINGRDVSTVEDVERIAGTLKSGQTVSLIVRGGQQEYDAIVNYRVQ
jgi:serine protease Do